MDSSSHCLLHLFCPRNSFPSFSSHISCGWILQWFLHTCQASWCHHCKNWMVTVTTKVVMLTVKLIHYCVVNGIVVTITTSCSDVHYFRCKSKSLQCSNVVMMSYDISNFEFDQAAARIIFCKKTPSFCGGSFFKGRLLTVIKGSILRR